MITVIGWLLSFTLTPRIESYRFAHVRGRVRNSRILTNRIGYRFEALKPRFEFDSIRTYIDDYSDRLVAVIYPNPSHRKLPLRTNF
jgi:hypothetical protein